MSVHVLAGRPGDDESPQLVILRSLDDKIIPLAERITALAFLGITCEDPQPRDMRLVFETIQDMALLIMEHANHAGPLVSLSMPPKQERKPITSSKAKSVRR